MSVADASDEFQPKETGYLFGDSDKPGDGVGFANVADEAFLNRKQRSSSERLDDGSKKNSDGTPRKKFWQRRQGGGVIGQQEHQSGASQVAFQNFFHRHQQENLESKLDESLAQLEEGGDSSQDTRVGSRGRNHSGASPILPAGTPAGREGSVDAVQGGKFKAAVKRAMAATKREKEAAARRGRTARESLHSIEHKGFIQVQDPALDKSCVEYGLTAELAEAKYRYGGRGQS